MSVNHFLVWLFVGSLSLTLSACERFTIDEGEPQVLTIAPLDVAKTLRAEGWRSASAALGVGGGYSVIFQVKSAHPNLAEYYHRVFIFAGTERDGRFTGALQLRMNMGGRTHILIYRHLNAQGVPTHLTFEHLHIKDTIRLDKPDFETAPNTARKEFIGTLSGRAFPEKFFTPLVMSESEARQRLNDFAKQ